MAQVIFGRNVMTLAIVITMLPCFSPRLLADPVSEDWLAGVRQKILEEEYHVTWQDGTHLPELVSSWHAPNRAHGFRTYFTGEGIRVIPRTAEGPSWQWGLALIGYGRGEMVWPVAEARLSPSDNRIEYDRNDIVEFYVNDTDGLEQGFTLYEQPGEQGIGPAALTVTPSGTRTAPLSQAGRSRAVHVDLALTGTLSPMISTDGRAIDFRTGRGVNVVHYSKLKVTDAAGKVLPSWMEGFNGAGVRGIRLVFDDTGAAYPVTVDPLASSPAWTEESNQADAQFGVSVSTAGDVDGDGYTDVIVGAHGYDNGHTDEGRAYVHHGSASGLAATAGWIAESNQAGAEFGRSVSTAGDVNGDGYADVIVGAPYHDNDETDEGRAYVYHGSVSGLAGTAAWTAECDQADAQFGRSVSTAGDVDGDGYTDVIVGAPYHDNVETDEGRAYVYHGSASGLAATAAWTAESDQADAYLGYSVSAAGDVDGDGYADVIVGAHAYTNGESNEGRVYAYHGSASGLAATAAWTAESDLSDARFGSSVSTAGDINGDGYADIVVGAYSYSNGETNEGGAYAYHGSASGLSASAAWTKEGDQAYAYFGRSVSTAGDVNGDGYADVIVGADYYNNPEADEGRAYVFHGSASGLGDREDWTAESDQVGAHLGNSVSTAGDVNGDGYADVIVGAWRYDNGENNEGRAYVYHGSASGLAETAGWTAESDQTSALFGYSVSTAGDVDGDGYADVIVGADRYDNGTEDEGRAYLYRGSASGLSAGAAWTAESNQADAYFGRSVSTAGDVNGDGYADVIVGAYSYDNVETNEGRAYVYHGSASGLGASAAWTAESDQDYARFGYSVSTAGDVNGDGYADVIVGANYHNNPEADEGRAYVYHGSASGLSVTADWTAESNQVGAFFGASVSTAGDVNGDGYSDVIVGAIDYDNGEANEGRAYVYHGSASGLSAGAAWTAESDQADAYFGRSVSTAGDVNGDGYADVIVGALTYDSGENDEGRAYVYHGSASGLSAGADWTAESDQANAYFGQSVSTAGDVNGDGSADVIVGAYTYNNGQSDEGRAFVYYGNDGPGPSLRPEQRRADDTGLVGRLGHARSPDGFRLAAIGRSPLGRTKARLQWEVKERGQPLDGTNTGTSTSWLDTGSAGVALNEAVSNIDPGDYHWRVRLLYDPVTSPFAQASRWFTIPWGGRDETDLSQSNIIGGVVWIDADGDGIRETGEAMLGSITVRLLDTDDTVVDQALTNSEGEYHFIVDPGQGHYVGFLLPSGYQFTLMDRGVDDTLDSDADPLTGETDTATPPYQAFDAGGWSAGMRKEGPCLSPDEEAYIYTMTTDAYGNTVLHFQDPNQPDQVTGYNVYRSSDAGLPHDQWPLEASDVTDMDESAPNLQWVDSSGDVSPTETWYYQVAAYNDICDAEGPW